MPTSSVLPSQTIVVMEGSAGIGLATARLARDADAWGQNDAFLTADGARAYLSDLPGAELHLLDTGHFATATHALQIPGLICEFLGKTAGAGV
jgi:hypothetical protein